MMRAAIGGNETAYCKLLEDLARVLRKSVRRELGGLGAPDNEVENVLQDILLAIHLKRHTWDASKLLTPWVTAVARNKIIDNLRRQGRRPEVELDLSDFDAESTRFNRFSGSSSHSETSSWSQSRCCSLDEY
ncbi:sigma factor [Hyphomicrobium sp. MC8b]|uniref:sigma factor n=1 Tax=Hyphomicrobium sp. MC8b TaxID=300273 RepID=UPI00391B24D8